MPALDQTNVLFKVIKDNWVYLPDWLLSFPFCRDVVSATFADEDSSSSVRENTNQVKWSDEQIVQIVTQTSVYFTLTGWGYSYYIVQTSWQTLFLLYCFHYIVLYWMLHKLTWRNYVSYRIKTENKKAFLEKTHKTKTTKIIMIFQLTTINDKMSIASLNLRLVLQSKVSVFVRQL